MLALSRIGKSVDDIVIPDRVHRGLVGIGVGVIEGVRLRGDWLKLTTPEETTKFKTPIQIKGASEEEFLQYIESFLFGKGWYLLDAHYRAERGGGLLQHRLTGMFCRDYLISPVAIDYSHGGSIGG